MATKGPDKELLAALVLGDGSKAKSTPGEGEGKRNAMAELEADADTDPDGLGMTDDDRLEAVAREYLDAIKADDAKAMAEAFRSMHSMCSMMDSE